MTERKPTGMPVETWVERQIRAAQERGDFDDLPGAGKPLPNRPGGALEWMAQKLRDENLDAPLPPSLAIPKEIEALPATLRKLRTEREVRALIEDLNARIETVHRNPPQGPPLRLGPLDVDEVLAAWAQAV